MPLLSYFLVVGSVLTGLLLMADALLTPPPPAPKAAQERPLVRAVTPGETKSAAYALIPETPPDDGTPQIGVPSASPSLTDGRGATTEERTLVPRLHSDRGKQRTGEAAPRKKKREHKVARRSRTPDRRTAEWRERAAPPPPRFIFMSPPGWY